MGEQLWASSYGRASRGPYLTKNARGHVNKEPLAKTINFN
jgi:hypothetical protein